MSLSAIDRHVSAVQTRLVLSLFLRAAGWSLVTLGAAACAGVLARQLFAWNIADGANGLFVAAGAAVVAFAASLAYALRNRPDPLSVAIDIDRRLSLHERLSTALSLRVAPVGEFSSLVVGDAERLAESLKPTPAFPIRWPASLGVGAGLLILAGLIGVFVPPMDLLGHRLAEVARAQQQQQAEQARSQVQKALALVNEQLPLVKGDTSVERAKADLQNLLARPIADPGAAQRSALSALQDLQKAVEQKVASNQRYAAAEADRRNLGRLQPEAADKGPVAEAQRAIAAGKFEEAVKELDKAVKDFQNLDADEQQKQAEQMKKLAAQLQQLASDPKATEQTEKRLEQALKQQGLGDDQARQLAKQMAQQLQQAATGSPQQQQQAMQNLQQQAQQAAAQLNNGQPPTPQQQQALEQALQQSMGQAQSQNNAQQLSQAAQQLAQAMQSAAQQQSQQQQQQAGNNPQQGTQARQGQQGNQQGQNTQQASSKSQGQQGQQGQQSQQGQQGQQSQSQQGQGQAANGASAMNDAMQQMSDALESMKDLQSDAQSLDSAARQAEAARSEQAGNCNGNGTGQNPGNKPGGNGHKNGMYGGAAQATGDRSGKSSAPFAVRQERSPTQNIEGGRVLASTLVRAGSVKGEAREQLKQVTQAANQEAAEEVDPERVSRASQKAVRDYFNSLSAEAEQK